MPGDPVLDFFAEGPEDASRRSQLNRNGAGAGGQAQAASAYTVPIAPLARGRSQATTAVTPPRPVGPPQPAMTWDQQGRGRVLLGSTMADFDRQMGVKYVGGDVREPYRVDIGARLWRRGQLLDTASIRQHFVEKPNSQVGAASLGSNRQNIDFDTPEEWLHALIWVCAPDPKTGDAAFYTHVAKVGHFHHTSFTAGREVLGAGEWIVKEGMLKRISANSGHYRPSIDYLYRAILHLSRAFQPDTTVFLYDKVADEWIDYPILDFIRKPTNGGRLKTHPDAL